VVLSKHSAQLYNVRLTDHLRQKEATHLEAARSVQFCLFQSKGKHIFLVETVLSHKACTKNHYESEPPIMHKHSFRSLALESLVLIFEKFSICSLRGEINLTKPLLGTEVLTDKSTRDYYNHKWKE